MWTTLFAIFILAAIWVIWALIFWGKAPSRAEIAGRRHLYMLSRAKREIAEYPPHGLGVTLGRILRDWASIGKSAVPGRRPADHVGSKPVNYVSREQRGTGDEEEDKKAVV